MPEANTNFTPNVFDNTYFNMELVIPIYGDGPDFAKVKKCLRDKNRLPIVRSHNNPILDTGMYELEYKGRHKASLAASAIVDNVFAQVYGEVNRHGLFQDVVDHRYNSTELKEQDVFTTTRNGMKRHIETTKGIGFLIQWSYGSTAWVTPQGYEEIISCTDVIICGTAPYCRRPYICMVDTACAGKTRPYHGKY